MKVQGVDKVKKAIAGVRSRHAKGIERGLKRAGLYLLGESMVLCPVEFGPLRASGNTRHEGSGFETIVFVAYGTDYAVFVHEIKENYHAPPTQSHFLEEPARTKQDEMSQIVLREVTE